jgi:hypothetical protein
MSEFTKGPWRVDPKAATRVVATGDRSVCSCGGHTDNRRDTTDENQANARLIAAAPTLLETLEELVADLRGRESDGSRFNPGTIHCLIEAQAAIAAAKGGSRE